ncbi:MAG: tail fiber protein [Bacteroidaceae bacterium]|nr:tail fiber protein [Bacteroidaceae bacterium]
MYKVIGCTFGGEGTEEFKVPDLRSKFVRGWDKRTRKIWDAIRVATGTRPKNIALMYCIKAKP